MGWKGVGTFFFFRLSVGLFYFIARKSITPPPYFCGCGLCGGGGVGSDELPVLFALVGVPGDEDDRFGLLVSEGGENVIEELGKEEE